MFKRGRPHRSVAIFVFGALLALLAIASPVRAMCVYSHIDRTLYVSLDWKWGFDPHWTIKSGDHKCTDGKGGQITMSIKNHRGEDVTNDTVTFKVDDHGWVSVHVIKRGSNGHPIKWLFINKDKHGHHKESKTRYFVESWHW